jgi:hypothetical protein
VKLSAYVATRNGSTRNPPGTFAQLLERARELSDELVVAVDYTTTDDTFEVARAVTKDVYHFAHDPMWAEMRRQSFRRCTGDWIFALDDDDRLGSQWSRELLARLMRARATTHYWIPSRFFVNETSYLSIAPWIGHSSVQLYRNIESIASIPTTLHYQLAIAGEPGYLAGPYVDAMDFVWHDRAYREAKVRVYDEAHDEEATQFNQARFYLYEDYYFETRRAAGVQPPIIMEPVTAADDEPGIDVRLVDCPAAMTAGQTYWVTVRIINRSEETLLPQSEFIRWGTLALAPAWSGEKALPPAVRTPFPARIMPNYQHDALIKVTAPAEAGSFEFRAEILQDGRRFQAGKYEARSVDIVPLVWPPKVADG